MADNPEQAIERNKKLLAQSEALLKQAKTSLDENAEVYQKIGIEPAAVTRFTNREDYPPEAKQHIEAVINDIDQSLAQIDADHGTTRKPHRPRRSHNMI